MKYRYSLILLLLLPVVVAMGARAFTAVIGDPPSDAAVALIQQQRYWHIAIVCLVIAALVLATFFIWRYVKKRRQGIVGRPER